MSKIFLPDEEGAAKKNAASRQSCGYYQGGNGRRGFGAVIVIAALATVFLLNYGNAAPADNSGTAAWSPLQKIKSFLQTKKTAPAAKPAAAKKSDAVIKVVSEESQVIEVVKKASPAVVSVIASAEVPKLEQCYQKNPMFENLPPEFRRFFDFEADIPSWCQKGTEKKRVGAATGFIVSPDGYILTNKHVVEDEKAEYTVVLNDEKNFGKKILARVLARDPSNDIAVLKISAKDLPFIALGDSNKLQVGQTAIAIGYALGEFDNTVSKGVISGLSRSIVAGGPRRGPEQLRGLIQTDAAINPGNSGGPLLDIGGNAIGMNVAMANGQSIGFAIPANLLRDAFEQVRDNGVIKEKETAFLGVRYIPITAELKENNKLPYDYGMLIIRGDNQTDLAVVPGSPADKAGLAENDIILEADGKQLNERHMLSDAVADKKPGDEVELKIYHKGEAKKVRVKLEKK